MFRSTKEPEEQLEQKKSYIMRTPFGEVCCEEELEHYAERYPELFFQEAPFNKAVSRSDRYLIVGRRGTGKSSLTQYFGIKKYFPETVFIDVNEPDVFCEIINTIKRNRYYKETYRIVQLWEFILWNLMFEKYKDQSPAILQACYIGEKGYTTARVIRTIIQKLFVRLVNDRDGELYRSIEKMIGDPVFLKAKDRLLKIVEEKKDQIIIAIDTLEQYPVEDEALMKVTSALIEASSKLNSFYSPRGIQIKTFVAAEIFPYLSENYIQNYLKFVKNAVFLNWRPKELVRLVCWRLFNFMNNRKMKLTEVQISTNWGNYKEVHTNFWNPFFGKNIKNDIGIDEHSLPYVLRHTQMRPRQLVVICNKIAERAIEEGVLPDFSKTDIVDCVRDAEIELATEVLNSYSKIYENVGNIVTALAGMPILFQGNRLDKIARITASEWPEGTYSAYNFKKILCELGIIGRVRKVNEERKIIEADFEYNEIDRLIINENTTCVIHPMFFRKLQIDVETLQYIIYPFPTSFNKELL